MIRVRLALLGGATVVLAGAALGAANYELLAADLARVDFEFAQHEAIEVSHVIGHAQDAAGVVSQLRSVNPKIFPEEGVKRLEVHALDGSPVFWFPEGSPPEPPWTAGLAAARRGESAVELCGSDSDPGARAAHLVVVDGVPRWIVVARIDRHSAVVALATLRQRLVLGVPLAALVVLLGSYGLLTLALRPLDRLVADARAIADEGPGRRLAPMPDGSELADLSRFLNLMLERTDATLTNLKRFAGDASHELRTPLTRIRGEAEVALRDGRTETARAALESILDEVDGMRRVVDGLLLLARGDAPDPQSATTFDLRAVVEGLVPEARLLGELRGIAVAGPAPGPPLPVRASRDLVTRAVWNLIDNALKHSDAGAEVTLALEETPGSVRCVVSDTGPGIAPEARTHLFEPFFRAAAARAKEGHGLGLPLARTIARRHGGDVLLEPSERGARFALVLPRPGASSTDHAPTA